VDLNDAQWTELQQSVAAERWRLARVMPKHDRRLPRPT